MITSSEWEPLPLEVTGGRARTYQALQDWATEQSSPDTVYFRKTALAERAELSAAQVTRVLRRLSTDGYLTYFPGNPGSLSRVVLLRRAGGN